MNMANWSCPFMWNLDKLLYLRTSTTNRNLDEYKFSGIPLMAFLISIIRAFEKLENNGDECGAKQYLEEAEITLSQLYKDTKMLDIIKALEHIYRATAACMIQKGALTSGVHGINERIPDIKDFNKIQLAGLDGCKSFILGLYHMHRIDESIALAKRAVEGNPQNALWYYVLGRSLRKKRRNSQGCGFSPSPLETNSFTIAAQLCPHAFYQIYFIQATHEAHFAIPNGSEDKLQFNTMQWNMYKNMRLTCNDQPVILLKIVLGMLRCRGVCDYSVIHSILDRVDELSKENNVSYFYRGRAYKLQNQYEKAFEYLKRSADMRNIVADFDYVQCMIETKKPAVDVIIYLVRLRMKYKNEHPDEQLPIHLNLAIMYYSIKDYTTSAELFYKTIKMVPDSQKLKRFYQFANIEMRSTYDFLRRAILPKMDLTIKEDPEFANIVLQLTAHCIKNLSKKELKSYKQHSNGRPPNSKKGQ